MLQIIISSRNNIPPAMMISTTTSTSTTETSNCSSDALISSIQKRHAMVRSALRRQQSNPSYKPLPGILTDFIAVTICDLLPIKYRHAGGQRTTPELVYFIQKVTFHARISCHIAVVALIYIERCKQALPKNAIGDEDTAHRIFIASHLVASKYLQGTAWAASQQQVEQESAHYNSSTSTSTSGSYSSSSSSSSSSSEEAAAASSSSCWLNNARMARICPMYTLSQINQLECAFLKLIKHRCWVDDLDVQRYLEKNRQDLLL